MWFRRSVSPRNVPVVSTGSFALDMALGTGGLPKGRVVEIFGPEAFGKTTLALHVIAEAQKQGGYCVFVDAEHALDPALAETIGVNTENLLLSQPDCGEQALSLVDTLIWSGSFDVVVVDSLPLCLKTIGSQVLVKIVKNKLAPPFKNAEFELEFGEVEIIDLAMKHKLVTKAGAFYTFNDQKLNGKEASKKFFAENESAHEELVMKLREKLHEAESKKERQTVILDGDTSEEIISPDTTDEEAVIAIEA